MWKIYIHLTFLIHTYTVYILRLFSFSCAKKIYFSVSQTQRVREWERAREWKLENLTKKWRSHNSYHLYDYICSINKFSRVMCTEIRNAKCDSCTNHFSLICDLRDLNEWYTYTQTHILSRSEHTNKICQTDGNFNTTTATMNQKKKKIKTVSRTNQSFSWLMKTDWHWNWYWNCFFLF